MSTFISGKAWGGARIGADGKVKVWKRAKDASMKRKWATSRKKTVISKAKSARFQRP